MIAAASPEPTAYTARFGRPLLLGFGELTDSGRLRVAILANSNSELDGRSEGAGPENKPSMLPARIVGSVLAAPDAPRRAFPLEGVAGAVVAAAFRRATARSKAARCASVGTDCVRERRCGCALGEGVAFSPTDPGSAFACGEPVLLAVCATIAPGYPDALGVRAASDARDPLPVEPLPPCSSPCCPYPGLVCVSLLRW